MPPVFYHRARRWPALVALAVAGLVVTVVLSRSAHDGTTTPDRLAAPSPDAVPLQHVHGLGIDPIQGALYAATHAGLVRFTGHGEPEHLGDHRDLMGFTVIGPDHFLASGHPDVAGLGRGAPGHLGLMESTDGGADWRTLSLRGEADLHAIARGGGQTYAVDATTGRFLASSDLKTWESRSASNAASIAVDPDEDRRVVAADGVQLQITDDGGRSWRKLEGPPLLLVAWGAGTDLWGTTADGATYLRQPADGTWRRLDTLPGEPQAILADESGMYAAVHDGARTTIQVFRDGAWKQQHRAD